MEDTAAAVSKLLGVTISTEGSMDLASGDAAITPHTAECDVHLNSNVASKVYTTGAAKLWNDVGRKSPLATDPLATENLLEDTDGLRRPP